jgi:hypothetical protein
MDKAELDSLVGLQRLSACQIDCINGMQDGTQMTGFVVTFQYDDGTNSTANAVGPWGYNGGATVYSQNKCVKVHSIQIGARRPSGTVEIVTGSSAAAPAGKCWARSGWGLVIANFVASADRSALKDLPLAVVEK